MWVLIFLFLIFTLLVGWVCFGYYIFIAIVNLFEEDHRVRGPAAEEALPFISVVVACYNEEKFIKNKIENLLKLDYPRERMEIIIIDGSSSDATQQIIQPYLADNYIKLRVTKQCGKVLQVNQALLEAQGQIIVSTDVDGEMKDDCLKKIAEEFKKDRQVYVVGVYSYPADSHWIDKYYWLTQNKGRILESTAFTSSIIIAVCYAFRKELLNEFPLDVVADDVYISYFANSRGYRTTYISATHVRELRGPKSIHEFVRHKIRKSNAFLKETLRFLYKIQESSGMWKIMFLTKLAQLTLLPWLVSFWCIVSVSLITLQRFDIVFMSCVFLSILLACTHIIFRAIRDVPDESSDYTLSVVIATFILSNIILLINGFAFPFYKQNSNYKKVDE